MTRFLICTAALLGLTACVPPPVEVGRALYGDACAVCHGPLGKGDGSLAGDLPKRPADLTGLSARNGGVFPQGAVMAVIDGYNRRDDPHGVMPEFGEVLQEGRLVPVDIGDGRQTPTPERLVALAAYVERLQE
ncbi:cytochrome c [Oceaniovalibus sp. ACAM 378]|uniref:c-type cytochrome n=1 Tax=Oceaniovalibus sp. ACAM 378 TaxID=2599923 RepID=UPI0011D3EE5E|nr:cytochrome c [Oceaniovalibus sp. ACAM 378]TYB89180.1 cytochrome c [Oceaniovalibus sp. ACAM 378]